MRLPGSAWIAVMAALLATGCSGHSEPPPDISGRWQLTQAVIDGVRYLPGNSFEGFDVTLITTSADAGQAWAGCDSLTFTVATDGSKFRLNASRHALFGCPRFIDPDPLNGHYLDALQGVTGGVRTVRSLTLTGPRVSLRYRKLERT